MTTMNMSTSLPERAAAILATLTDGQIRTITRVWSGDRVNVTHSDTVLAELIDNQRLTILGMVLVGLPEFAAKVLDSTGGSLSGLDDPQLDALEALISALERLTPDQVEKVQRLHPKPFTPAAPVNDDQRITLLIAALAFGIGAVALALSLLNTLR